MVELDQEEYSSLSRYVKATTDTSEAQAATDAILKVVNESAERILVTIEDPGCERIEYYRGYHAALRHVVRVHGEAVAQYKELMEGKEA